jgi:methylenetetrahydrofolate--tRNA-(uracil-5-)-methyltransferase
MGALLNYITATENTENFQPMNINFGILEPLPYKKIKKKERNLLYINRSLETLREWIDNRDLR